MNIIKIIVSLIRKIIFFSIINFFVSKVAYLFLLSIVGFVSTQSTTMLKRKKVSQKRVNLIYDNACSEENFDNLRNSIKKYLELPRGEQDAIERLIDINESFGFYFV